MTDKQKGEEKKLNKEKESPNTEKKESKEKDKEQIKNAQEEDINVLGRKIHQPKGGHSGSHG
ncbi:hypothetical protein RCC89_10155 [Cytophagaceae bacterium ABcell3]|nr:hypothetical protein RCC89_10155 [Cytophagaceae bacterium ABcell3]